MLNVYASIGNSDDKLTQAEWSDFTHEFMVLIESAAERVHGEWYSLPQSRYQNCCVAFELTDEKEPALVFQLGLLCSKYRQDSIAWAQAEVTFVWPPNVTIVCDSS